MPAVALLYSLTEHLALCLQLLPAKKYVWKALKPKVQAWEQEPGEISRLC